jgi:hypothetical protein
VRVAEALLVALAACSSSGSSSSSSPIVGEWILAADGGLGGTETLWFNADGTCGESGTVSDNQCKTSCTYAVSGDNLTTTWATTDAGPGSSGTGTMSFSNDGDTLTTCHQGSPSCLVFARVNSNATNACS